MPKEIFESLIPVTKGFKTIVGKTTPQTPTVIYIRNTAKITPIVKRNNYGDSVKKIKSAFYDKVDDIVKSSPRFLDEYICVMDMSEESVKYGNRSFVKYMLYVKPKKTASLEDNTKKAKTLVSKLNKALLKLLKDEQLRIA